MKRRNFISGIAALLLPLRKSEKIVVTRAPAVGKTAVSPKAFNVQVTWHRNAICIRPRQAKKALSDQRLADALAEKLAKDFEERSIFKQFSVPASYRGDRLRA